MIEPVVTFAAAPDGVHVFRDGKLVAVIRKSSIPALVMEAAKVLRSTEGQ